MANFSMLDHIDKLTSVKGGKYICPACNGTNFSVDKTTGAYNCYDGCESRNVREAVAPWENRYRDQAKPKAARPAQKRQWIYTDVEGNPCIQVNRTDDGNGKREIYQAFWQSNKWTTKASDEIKAKLKKSVTIYRHAETLKAIEAGQVIFWVEGEPCADLLWDLGLPATTSIGGSMAYKSNGDYSQVLTGASVVICPDRDVNGLKYADLVAADYPEAKWLYAFPDNPAWGNLPKDKGLDIADWVADFNLDAPQIMGLVEDRRKASGHESKLLTVLDGGKNVPTEGIRAAVLQAIGESLQGSAKTERIGELATHYRSGIPHVNRLWQEILEEQEQADDSEDEAGKRLESELSITSQSLPFEVLPYQIAMHLPRQAELIGTTTEALVMTAFPVLASVINAGTGLRVKAGANPWSVSGIIWIALVAMSGDGKTPTIGVWMNALKSLQKTENENYEERAAEFKRAKRAWDTAVRKGEEPDSEEPEPPVLRWTVVKQATLQGLAETQMGQPNHGCLIYKPELTALQNSFGMHSKAGASDDLEQFLDLRDGGEILTRNAGRIRRTESTRFSLMGGIQPSKLLEQMGDRKDSQGFWGRFCIYNLPTVDPDDNETDLDVSEGRQLSDLLSAVVLRINSFPPCIHELSLEAKERGKVYRKELQSRARSESREQMRNFTKKMKGYVHEFALVLHLLDAAVESGVEPAKDVSLETLERAIAVSEFCHAQRHIFEAQADAAAAKTQTKTTITTIQAEILKRARSTKQAVTARDCRNFIHTCSGVDVESLRACFVSLEKAGYGKTIGAGNRLKFEAFQPTTVKEDEPMTYEYAYEPEEKMLATA